MVTISRHPTAHRHRRLEYRTGSIRAVGEEEGYVPRTSRRPGRKAAAVFGRDWRGLRGVVMLSLPPPRSRYERRAAGPVNQKFWGRRCLVYYSHASSIIRFRPMARLLAARAVLLLRNSESALASILTPARRTRRMQSTFPSYSKPPCATRLVHRAAGPAAPVHRPDLPARHDPLSGNGSAALSLAGDQFLGRRVVLELYPIERIPTAVERVDSQPRPESR